MTATTSASSVFAPSTASVRFDNPFVPSEFFQNRPGLWVSESFRNLVVAKAQPTEAGKTFVVKPQVLGRDATDAEIEDELGGKHLLDETAAAAVVAGLITAQPNEEALPLLNNGNANILYLFSCVVSMDWDADSREWNVNAFRRDGARWFAGYRVFSPAN
ncbi:MAG: hypothetical protein Q8P21_02255 [bacterium]|nr:hypothetical protein [bacterium]